MDHLEADDYTLKSLKAIAKERGLLVGGNKTELVLRINNYLSAKAAAKKENRAAAADGWAGRC